MQEDPSLTKAWQKTVKVAVTGASGQISNHLLFMVSMGLHACILSHQGTIHICKSM
jgi:hypothetical protein